MIALARFFHHLYFLCQKELLSLFKDPRMRIQLVMPVIIEGFLFGYAANYNIEEVPYAVVDNSGTASSRDFLAHIAVAPTFSCTAVCGNVQEVSALIDAGDILGAVVVPEDFEKRLLHGGQAPVQVITDGRNPMIASMVTNYITHIAADWSAAEGFARVPVTIETRTWFNPNQLSRWTFLPSFLAMIAFVQVMFLAGLSIAKEREQGTFDQLLVTPLSPTEILIGKATPPVLVGLFQAFMVFLIARYWFDVPFAGNLFTLFMTLLIFMVSTTGLGLSISSVAKNMQQVLVYLLVLMVPMVLLSGLVTPIHNMPAFLQAVTYANPMRFVIDAVRRIYLEGAGLCDIAWDFVPMLAVAAVTMPLAGWLFRHKTT